MRIGDETFIESAKNDFDGKNATIPQHKNLLAGKLDPISNSCNRILFYLMDKHSEKFRF